MESLFKQNFMRTFQSTLNFNNCFYGQKQNVIRLNNRRDSEYLVVPKGNKSLKSWIFQHLQCQDERGRLNFINI